MEAENNQRKTNKMRLGYLKTIKVKVKLFQKLKEFVHHQSKFPFKTFYLSGEVFS